MSIPEKIIKIRVAETSVDVDVSRFLPIIDTPTFQRIDEIKQLGMVYKVWPGGTHTRKIHSIGTLYYIQKIGDCVGLSPSDKNLLEVTALIHDIGHGPFSHASEILLSDMSGKTHEEKSVEKLSGIRDEIEKCGARFEDVVSIFQRRNNLWKLIWGLVGADKLDYVKRDLFECGLGSKETERITTYVYFDGENYAVEEKAKEIVKDFLYNRWLAHREIYLRKPVEIIETMLRKSIDYAIREGCLQHEKIWDMTDYQLETEILKSKSDISRRVFVNIMNRNWLKTAGVLKLKGYENIERVADKPIFVEGMDEEQYSRLIKKYHSMRDVTCLEESLMEEFKLGAEEIAVTTSPAIERLSPEDVSIYSQEKKKITSIFRLYPSFKRLLEEEMKAHYSFRILVENKRRKDICEKLKSGILGYIL